MNRSTVCTDRLAKDAGKVGDANVADWDGRRWTALPYSGISPAKRPEGGRDPKFYKYKVNFSAVRDGF
jgi:hypothetical protein